MSACSSLKLWQNSRTRQYLGTIARQTSFDSRYNICHRATAARSAKVLQVFSKVMVAIGCNDHAPRPARAFP